MTIEYFTPIVDSDDQPKLDIVAKGELVANAVTDWHTWTNMIQDLRDRSVESRQLYCENRPDHIHYDSPDDASKSLSRVRRPVLAQAVDSVVSQQHLASYPADEGFFTIKPRNQEAKESMALYENHCEKRLSEVDFIINTLKDRKNLMLDGTSCVWHPFIRESELKTSYVPKTFLGIKLPGKPRKVKKEQVTLEATAFIPLNFEDWRVDPLMDNFKEAGFMWRRWVSVDDIKDIDAFENTENIGSFKATWDDSESNKDENYRNMGINPTFEEDCPLADNMVLLYERWGDFHVDDELYTNHVLIFSNDHNFHYFGPNPYDHQRKPFSVTPYIEMPGTMYGKSLAQDIIPLCHALDTLLNQAIDIIGRTGNPTATYLVTDTAINEYFADGEVALVPGELIPVQSHDSIRPLTWDLRAIEQVEAIMQRLKEEIRESTGGVAYATGGMSEIDTERTATETSILAQGTSTRNQLLIQTYEENRLKPFMNMSIENDRQFMTQEVFIEDEMKPITPNMVKMMEMGVDITGSKSIMNRAKEIQDYNNILQNYVPGLIQNGLAQTNGDTLILNIPEMWKRLLNMSGMRDIDNLVEVQTAQEQQEMMPQAPQLGALPGGLSGIQQALVGQAPRDLAAA